MDKDKNSGRYEPQKIESKWQEKWASANLYTARDFSPNSKFYTLIEFPYPSGAGLHVGHVRSWSAMDAYSRKKRMEGKNVLYPIGWDAFGLPAENYAIKNKIHPSVAVKENIANFKRQIKSLGISFDWSREVNTTDPKYYKWTQWIFLKFLEKGLAYRADVAVNWCPFCKTNLADEEVLPDGTHERCGTPTEKRLQKQWLLRITKYAQRLIDDLKLVDYSTKISIQQVNWIGKSEGIMFKEKVKDLNVEFEVFDTVPQTFLAQTFTVIAPEHPMVEKLVKGTEHEKPVMEFIEMIKKKKAAKKFDIEKDMEGIFTGRYVDNPFGTGDLPIWVASYVVAEYGTGIVNCSAHDDRDFAFAKKYGIPLKIAMLPKDKDLAEKVKNFEICYHHEPEGIIQTPEEFKGMAWAKVREPIIEYIEKKGLGRRGVHFHLRDWVFSRQHYWGEPIPVVYCDKDGIVPVSEKDLPVELPYLEKYEPSGTGESPLAAVTDWVNTTCPKCGGPAKRETDTMPNWAGSNWYYLRYLDPQNSEELAEKKKMEYWMPVDLYQGGFEHTTLHLLYSRFVYKFLYDCGVVPTPEPYAKRRSHGIVLGPDGRKMSKSFGNVINPDEIVNKFGADTLRVYEMFMGPFDQTIAWSEEGVEGCFRFLKRVWALSVSKTTDKEISRELLIKLNKTVKKVGEDIELLKFNTAVAYMMEFINDWQKDSFGLTVEDLKKFLLILSPFAPHITEELWERIQFSVFGSQLSDKSRSVVGQSVSDKQKTGKPNSGNRQLKTDNWSIHQQSWPSFDKKFLVEEEMTVVVQVNGKVRDTLRIQSSKFKVQSYVEEKAKESEKVKKHLEGKSVKKTIYVEGKIINFVVG